MAVQNQVRGEGSAAAAIVRYVSQPFQGQLAMSWSLVHLVSVVGLIRSGWTQGAYGVADSRPGNQPILLGCLGIGMRGLRDRKA